MRFTSWLRGESTLRLEARDSVGPSLLEALLQGEYSTALYGAEGRVAVSSLRLVWLSLLSETALQRIASVAPCKANARPPFRPFFWGIDTIANPVDAMWVHQPGSHGKS